MEDKKAWAINQQAMPISLLEQAEEDLCEPHIFTLDASD